MNTPLGIPDGYRALLSPKAHIGAIQVSLWPAAMREECGKKGGFLL